MRTDNLRNQHKAILTDLSKIETLLTPQILATQAREARSLLSSFAGKITLHLAMEDASLYSVMIDSNDSNAKTTAQAFKSEMGSLGQAFNAYLAKWPSYSSIENNPKDFIQETAGIATALKQRIAKEESKLYPLADAL